MINLMTLCRNVATELELAPTPLFAILFLTAPLSQAVVAQEPLDSYPTLESPSAVVVEAEVGQSILEYLEAQDLSQGLNTVDGLNTPGELNLPEDMNVLTRGPLHEAFASAHQADPKPSALVFKTPPELIDEVPPEYKPDGNSVQWISGYWAWDDAQSDFIWISGIWRDVPPNRRWIPGYWDSQGDGYHWISGIWTEETQLELGYLPEPPASIDQGPSTTAPSDEYFYVPGNWTHQDGNYRWLAGHWQPLVENWIWIPARYVWTPRGCVYQSGYWDYEMDNRGTCFAPVQFTQPVYLANNYSYRPTYALNLNVDFLTHLFVRPRCGHYFYGDWYASNFNNVQYRPWVSYSSHFRNYDPLLAYYGHRRSSLDSRYNVVQYLSRQHNFYVNNRDYRPRPTYRSQNNHVNKFKHVHVTGPKGSTRQRRPHDDFLRKSSYVRSYKDLRMHDDRHRGKSVGGPNRGNQQIKYKHHHKVADKERRDSRRDIEQLVKAQRDRKRKEHSGKQISGKQVVVQMPSGNRQTQNGRPTRQRDAAQSPSRKPSQKPSQKPTIVNRAADRRPGDAKGDVTSKRTNQPGRSSQSTRNGQRDNTRLADQQKQVRQQRDRDAAGRSAQQDQARRSQNDQARRAQDDQARKARQDRARKAAQQSQRDAARKAQQDQARRAQQDQARRAQQDQARRAQLEADRRAQEQVRRFREQQKQSDASPNISGKMRMQNIPSRQIRAQAARQDQRDLTRNAAQQSQRDAAQRAQQKLQQDQAQRARQDQARRAQQDKARRAQQDQARRAQQEQARRNQQAAANRARQDQARRSQQKAQQERARQQAAQRAKQQQAQRDAAKRAQQKSQRDAAKRAQASRQKSAQKSRKAPAQQSKASRLRNRSSSKK